jgi:hypothetical protein
MCTLCKESRYCDAECQREHWWGNYKTAGDDPNLLVRHKDMCFRYYVRGSKGQQYDCVFGDDDEPGVPPDTELRFPGMAVHGDAHHGSDERLKTILSKPERVIASQIDLC